MAWLNHYPTQFLLFSQTLTISCCHHVVLTPFSLINTYLKHNFHPKRFFFYSYLNLLNSDYNLFEKEKNLQKFLINKIIDENLTPQEQKCVDVLGISMPININNIKKAYKKLVKIFHPDVNKGSRKAEKKFIEINEAYKILLRKFLKLNIVEN